jgi:hypothetical protein
MFSIAIGYRPPGGRFLMVATVTDEDLLARVAALALEEAFAKARRLAERDPMLGQIELAEAQKLRLVLRHCIRDPEPAANTDVM